MAFSVTPTSGAGPYTLTAVIENNMNVNGVDYVATASSSDQVGSCPVEGIQNALSPTSVNTLVQNGVVVSGAPTVASGSCRTYTLNITRVADGVVISSSSTSVDNV